MVSMVAGCQSQFQPGTYTDDKGREVDIEKIPERIVSHVPGITEILFALDLEISWLESVIFVTILRKSSQKIRLVISGNPLLRRLLTWTQTWFSPTATTSNL